LQFFDGQPHELPMEEIVFLLNAQEALKFSKFGGSYPQVLYFLQKILRQAKVRGKEEHLPFVPPLLSPPPPACCRRNMAMSDTHRPVWSMLVNHSRPFLLLRDQRHCAAVYCTCHSWLLNYPRLPTTDFSHSSVAEMAACTGLTLRCKVRSSSNVKARSERRN